MSNSIRERTWYVVTWCILTFASGAWTVFAACMAFEVLTNPGHNEEQGMAAIGMAALLIVTIPVYVIFFVLLCFRPRAKEKSRIDSR